jgi:hypothetical protein
VRRGKDDPVEDARARDIVRADMLGAALPAPPPGKSKGGKGGKKGTAAAAAAAAAEPETMESRRMIQVYSYEMASFFLSLCTHFPSLS